MEKDAGRNVYFFREKYILMSVVFECDKCYNNWMCLTNICIELISSALYHRLIKRRAYECGEDGGECGGGGWVGEAACRGGVGTRSRTVVFLLNW